MSNAVVSTTPSLPDDVKCAVDADHDWARRQRAYHKVHHSAAEHQAIDWHHQDMIERLHWMVHRWKGMDSDAIRREVELRHDHDGMAPTLLGSLLPGWSWIDEMVLRGALMDRELAGRAITTEEEQP